jgi:Coenzyme F420-reducing hydrogenase, beta subunit
MSAPENAAGAPPAEGKPKAPPAPSVVGDALKPSDISVGGKYIGWSVKDEIRKEGGSGGLVTSILAGALEKGID